ncbi:hypothetical protein ACEQPO_02420 [Bacillus sp. SL00103]
MIADAWEWSADSLEKNQTPHLDKRPFMLYSCHQSPLSWLFPHDVFDLLANSLHERRQR